MQEPSSRKSLPDQAVRGVPAAEIDLLRAVVRHSLDPQVVIDQHGKVLLASDSMHAVFGWDPEDLLGLNVKVLMPEPHRSAHDRYLENWRTTGATNIIGRTREFEVRRRDGSPLLVDLSVARAVLPGGESVFIGEFRDVTARRRAELLVRDSESRFRGIFDGAQAFLGLLSTDGTLLEMNNTAAMATGVPRDEMAGRLFWEAPWWGRDPGGPDRIRLWVERAACGETMRSDVVVAARDGRLLDVDFSIAPIRDAEGRVVLLLPEGRDITELKRAQKAETSMLRALAQVGESAAVLVHEIKNPITAVNVALRAVADQLGTEHKVVLEDLASRMQRLQELMRGTLSFAKPVQIKRAPVEARRYLEGCVSRLRLLVVKAGAEVEVQVDGDGVELDVDHALFEEVLSNLVVNALDAKDPAKGRALVRISAAPAGDCVELRVDDNGPGIPEHKREDVFRPFVTTKSQGTGLGLAICRKIVEEHGGTIDLGASPLGGARFTIRLRPRKA